MSHGIYICVTPNRLSGPHDISKYFDVTATRFHLKEYTNTELSDLFKEAGFLKVRAYVGAMGIYVRFPLFLLSTGGRKYVPSGIAGFDSEEEKEVA